MTDRTIAERMRRMHKRRREMGWRQVTVWVPTKEDAEKIYAMASEARRRGTTHEKAN